MRSFVLTRHFIKETPYFQQPIIKLILFQIFREFELPAELKRTVDLREIVKEQRNQFVLSITNSTQIRNLDNLDRFVSMELEKYEQVFDW